MDGVGGRRVGRLPSQVEVFPDWLTGLDTSKAPREVLEELKLLERDTGVLSKAAQSWLIPAFLRQGKDEAMIALFNKFSVTDLVAGMSTMQCAGRLIAMVEACPSMRVFGLGYAQIRDEEARALASTLATCRHVNTLKLISCDMSTDACRTIADGLSDMHGLESLYVRAHGDRPWLLQLIDGIARCSSLTSLELCLDDIDHATAAKVGRALRGNRSLTSLAFEVMENCPVAESFATGLFGPAANRLEQFPLPRLTRIRVDAHPVEWDENKIGKGFFSEAFCDLLTEQIETRSALESVCIKPAIQLDKSRLALLAKAVQTRFVEFDIELLYGSRLFRRRDLKKVLASHLMLREHQRLLVAPGVLGAAAAGLLSSIPVLGGSLPHDVTRQIVPRMMEGADSLRERWTRRGWMQVSKAAYVAAVNARNKARVDLLATSDGRALDGGSVVDLMRLRGSGVRLSKREESRLGKAFPESKEFAAARRKAAKVLVNEHLGLAEHLLNHRNSDGALSALEVVQRLVEACGLKEPGKLRKLRSRIAGKR